MFHLLGFVRDFEFKAEIKRCGLISLYTPTSKTLNFFLPRSFFLSLYLPLSPVFIINWKQINERRKNRFLGLFKWRCIDCKTLFYLMQSITCMACGFWVSMWYKTKMSAEKNHQAQNISHRKSKRVSKTNRERDANAKTAQTNKWPNRVSERASERTNQPNIATNQMPVNAFIVHCA